MAAYGKQNGAYKHGLVKTKIYWCWVAMIRRCTMLSDKAFPNYGGRGIKVCDRWSRSLENFVADVGNPPGKEYSLDRIDNSRGYEPGNVRWATSSQQIRNTRANRRLTLNGVSRLCVEWIEILGPTLGIDKHTVSNRIRRGWSDERILTTPARRYSKHD